MKVYDKKLIDEFIKEHAGSKNNLEVWLAEALDANWKVPNDIKERYRSASFLSENRVVFNIGGNSYRLLVQISFKFQIVTILRIGTHAEYDKWKL